MRRELFLSFLFVGATCGTATIAVTQSPKLGRLLKQYQLNVVNSHALQATENSLAHLVHLKHGEPVVSSVAVGGAKLTTQEALERFTALDAQNQAGSSSLSGASQGSDVELAQLALPSNPSLGSLSLSGSTSAAVTSAVSSASLTTSAKGSAGVSGTGGSGSSIAGYGSPVSVGASGGAAFSSPTHAVRSSTVPISGAPGGASGSTGWTVPSQTTPPSTDVGSAVSSPSAVPEPASLSLMLLGVFMLALTLGKRAITERG